MGAMSPLGHRVTCPQAPQHLPRSTAKPSWHSAAMLGRQRASKTAWGPPGASMGITWSATSTARVSPLSPHSPCGHTMRGCGGVPSEGLSSRASKAWVSAPEKGSHSAATSLGTQHPAHPTLPRVPGTLTLGCSRGHQGLTLCSGALPTAGWPDRQSLPGDTRHSWGVLHWNPAKGQLLACWWQHSHHLGTGNG